MNETHVLINFIGRNGDILHRYEYFNKNDVNRMIEIIKTSYAEITIGKLIDNYHISIPVISILIKKLMKDKIIYKEKPPFVYFKNRLIYMSNLGLYINTGKLRI